MDSNGTSAIVTTTEGVEFDMIARKWRRIWSADNDKKSLAEVQKVLGETKVDTKAVDGVTSFQAMLVRRRFRKI